MNRQIYRFRGMYTNLNLVDIGIWLQLPPLIDLSWMVRMLKYVFTIRLTAFVMLPLSVSKSILLRKYYPKRV
jgi:hypothetical protein